MIASSQDSRLTPEAYLQLEADREIKHEYIDGEIYAMAGVTDTHVSIAGNIFALLLGYLRGSDYRVYISDMKVSDPAVKRQGLHAAKAFVTVGKN